MGNNNKEGEITEGVGHLIDKTREPNRHMTGDMDHPKEEQKEMTQTVEGIGHSHWKQMR